MPLATCVRCHKMFSKVDSPVCLKCQPEEEADYEKVRDALDKDQSLTAEQVAEATQVELEVVERMLDQGLIASVIGAEPPMCGRCGAPAISMSKKLCQACLEKLNAEVAMAQRSVRLGERKRVEIGGSILNIRDTIENKLRK